METIKNYLEAMFANMPNTESVRKAKEELFQMMEDKYNELISDGVNENTAVGTVISEFGNLDELADDLGLSTEVSEQHTEENVIRRHISLDDAKEYVAAKTKAGFKIGIGVMLCIMSVIGPMLADTIKIPEEIGILIMFGMIAVAVGLFIYTGVTTSQWDFVKKEPCQIDMMTASYLDDEKTKYLGTYALRLTIGVVLCAICWLPVVVLSALSRYTEEFGAMLLFVFVGLGVFLIIYNASIKHSYEELLVVNDPNKVSGNYVKGQAQIEWMNDGVKLMMELYWSVITCAYLIWSFISFQWYKTWIIWPIAAVIHVVLKTCLRKR